MPKQELSNIENKKREEKFPGKELSEKKSHIKTTVSKIVWHWYMNGQINVVDVF